MTISKTDPLSRYTSTGSNTSQAAPQQKLNTKAKWWEKIVAPIATVAASPFSRGAQEDIGRSFGNVISGIPIIGRAAEAAAVRTPESVVRTPANIITDLTGVSALTRGGKAIDEGRYVDAAGNIALGGLTLYGGAAAAAARPATSLFGPTGFSQATKFGGPVPTLIGTAATKPLRTAAATGAAVLLGDQMFSGTPQVVSADRAEEMARRTQANAAFDYLRTPQYDTTPYGSTIRQTFTDAEGRVHNWNPRSKMYEVTGTVKPGTTGAGGAPVLGLSAAQQLEFDNRLRDIEAETQAVLSGLSGQASSARSEAKAGREESRRQVSGASQDLSTQLAFLGLDTSPGVLDVGQEFEAREGAQRESAISKSLAETISGISASSAEAKRRAASERDKLAAARLQLEEENIQKKRDDELLKIILGGK